MRKRMRLFVGILFVFLMFILVACGGEQTTSEQPTTLRLATTTSTQDSGLLDYLLPVFEEKYHVKVDVLAQGTGQAIETASRGDADVILVHARKAEEKFVADGHGSKRYDVMYNDFVIVGPKNDPDGIKGKSLDEAFTLFTNGQAPFLSRGDDSGTNKKELEIWQKLGIKPKGDWYLSVGKGMGDTLIMANEQQGYTLTDRATYSFMKDKLSNLDILVEGDKGLLNPYGIIAVNPEKHQGINHEDAQKLIDFILSDEGQQLIKDYKVNGQQLFFTYEK
ncbi:MULTISPECIES: substrate-binding domain-containing protein [Tepidibacillus]|nr:MULTISPECIES: substrate-binding domain-containing protein [Tepidibacillus]GBF11123.1 PBP superfamily domain protein [Tepidibacillus sp. HK-1]